MAFTTRPADPDDREIDLRPDAGFDETFGRANRYEERLRADSRWALTEGSIFFEGRGAVRQTLKKIVRALNALGISYSVIGSLALFHHGYRRYTDNVDLLVTADGLRKIHANTNELGCLPAFSGSRHLRDSELGVKIKLFVEGQFPGDGKPLPVIFPNPDAACVEADGIRYLNLPSLIEIKLAAGTASNGRLKDIGDVMEAMKAIGLPEEFADALNPFVREKFRELWGGLQVRYPDAPHDEYPDV